ncbi:MAG: hypothetical protein LBM08_02735 [Dysgonamonadaceae bacterium]|nr:hypothetical protein [Dysgonamonadaceae bacterium]
MRRRSRAAKPRNISYKDISELRRSGTSYNGYPRRMPSGVIRSKKQSPDMRSQEKVLPLRAGNIDCSVEEYKATAK